MNESIIRQNQSEHIDKLASALAAAQAKLHGAKKDATNPFFKSQYATLESVYEAIRGPLAEQGLSVIQPTEWVGDKTFVRTVIVHSSGQWVDGLYPIITQKNDPQGLGSGMSYARRYALMAMVGIPASDDDAEGATARITTQTVTTVGNEFNTKFIKTADAAYARLAEGKDTVGDGFISDKQAKRLFAIAKKHNVSNENIKGILKKYGIEETKQIKWKDYDSIVTLVEASAFNPKDWERTDEPA